MEGRQYEARDQSNASGRDRFEGLDAYRGIAALLLVVFHAYQYSREGTGAQTYLYEGTPLHVLFGNLDMVMSFFFVLSGFLVFLPFARAAVDGGSPLSVRSFLIRRAIRILPVYYVAIVLVWTWRYYSSEEQWVSLLQHLTFTQVFSREHIFWTIGPSWAVALIVQFYLFVALVGPPAYRVCSRLATPRNRTVLLAGSALTLAAVSVGYKWWAIYVVGIPKENWPIYFGPLAKLDNFAIGMLLAVAVAATGRPKAGEPVPSLLGLAGLTLMAGSIAYSGDELVKLYSGTLVSLAFMLVLAATVLLSHSSPLLRVLELPPLRYLSLISYGVFLWHEPILIELGKHGFLIDQAPDAFTWNAIILITLSIVAGALSYGLIERPALRLRRLFGRERPMVQRYPT